ncbi:MAG: hypothetical protein M1828_006973 [Chrysothrix sp. TS-e1954]|nr:MAG: hypothetical protein M1828_006973 [Chrysothrix sp. TS-e1954]
MSSDSDFDHVSDLSDCDAPSGANPRSISHDEIRAWLKPTDYLARSSEYRRHLDSQAPGTGIWVQQTAEYKQWQTTDRGLLWLKGCAGSGKSVTAASMIDLLRKNENVPVLSFFFRQIIEANRDSSALVRDWLAQLVEHSPKLRYDLRRQMKNNKIIDMLALDHLWRQLLVALKQLPKVYCVADALDEMTMDENFLHRLNDLNSFRPQTVKILITSRPKQYLQSLLRDSRVLQISLERDLVERDITKFINHRLQDGTFRDVDQETRGELRCSILRRSDGLFLYARLIFDQIMTSLQQSPARTADLQEAVQSLPNGLEEMYTRMLDDSARQVGIDQDVQLFILQCATHSARPMRLLELSTALEIRFQNRMGASDAKSIARHACAPLLEILEDETMQVVHHSFTEYLRSHPTPHCGPTSLPKVTVTPHDAEKALGLTCLQYLNMQGTSQDVSNDYKSGESSFFPPRHGARLESFHGRYPTNVTQTVLLQHPFLRYAMTNWFYHLRRYDRNDAEVFAAIGKLAQPHHTGFQRWVKDMMRGTETNMRYAPILETVSPLHLAAFTGLQSYAESLIAENSDVNVFDQLQRQPLYWAAQEGHSELVELLLDSSADIDNNAYDGLKPMHAAAARGHAEVVKLLLSRGVSPVTVKTHDIGSMCGSSPSTFGQTPLQLACQSGHLQSVMVMIPYLNLRELERALCFAAEAAQSKILRALLEGTAVSPDAVSDARHTVKTSRGEETALYLAATTRDRASVACLLEAGADVSKPSATQGRSASGHRGKETPIHGFVRHHQASAPIADENAQRTFQMLVEAGCDLEAKTCNGRTALALSVANSWYQGVKMLVDAGAALSATDDDGYTPLHLMCRQSSDFSILRLLLSHGAESRVARKFDGLQPIHCAAENTFTFAGESALTILLENGAEINAQTRSGETALHYAARKSGISQVETIQQLLQHGADVKLRSHAGQTCLHVLRDSGSINSDTGTSIVDTLITAGIELDVQDYRGRTALHEFGRRWQNDSFAAILKAGASISIRDEDGKTPLCLCLPDSHRVASCKNFDLLIDAGADALVQDREGNTLLHTIASYYTGCSEEVRILEKLLTCGVPLNARTHKSGLTALHVVAAQPGFPDRCAYVRNNDHDHESFVSVCRRMYANFDPNIVDAEGFTALHFAAANSEYQANELLEAGANAFAKSQASLTPLHAAAVARQSNVVSLLTRLAEEKKLSVEVDATDVWDSTALHFACRSGRPESVQILLEAGADMNRETSTRSRYGNGRVLARTPLEHCADFEDENNIWKVVLGYNNSYRPNSCAQSTFVDKFRPRLLDRRATAHAAISAHKTARIGDIVRLLLARGAPWKNTNARFLAIECKSAEMVALLRAEALKEDPDAPMSAHETRLLLPRLHTETVIAATKLAETSEQGPEDFLDIMDDDLFDCLLARGVIFTNCKLGPYGAHKLSALAQFVKEGRTYRTRQLKFQAKNYDIERPLPRTDDSRDGEERSPLLLLACSTEIVNLAVVRILVEEVGVDIDLQQKKTVGFERKDKHAVPGPTALHILAQGNWYWNIEAMGYLIGKGARMNLVNEVGDTPLHVACSRPEQRRHGYWRDRCAEILIALGADMTLLNHKGESCLSKAASSPSTLRRLLDKPVSLASGQKPVLNSVIERQDIRALQMFLDTGTDCNVPYEVPASNQPPPEGHWVRYQFPLLMAALPPPMPMGDLSRALEMVVLLLAHGANMGVKVSDGETLTHHLLRYAAGPVLHFLLSSESLDVDFNMRNARGETVLHAACTSHQTVNAEGIPVCAYGVDEAAKAAFRPTYIQVLHSERYRANLDWSAIDGSGNTVLHHIFDWYRDRSQHLPELLQSGKITKDILDHKNDFGFAPIHEALRHQVDWLVTLYVEYDANIAEPDSNGDTILHHIARAYTIDSFTSKAYKPIVERYLSIEPSAIHRHNKAGETALLARLAHGDGPDMRFVMYEESKAPHIDALTHLTDTLGADVKVRNSVNGETALHVIAKRDIRSGLLAPNARGEIDYTTSIFKHVMDAYKLDALDEDNEGRSALDCAAASGNTGILKLFERTKREDS